MSTFQMVQIERAREDVNRAMSMISLMVASLRLEEAFQDEHVNRPAVALDTYIPTMGEIIDTALVCREDLLRCWEALGRKEADYVHL